MAPTRRSMHDHEGLRFSSTARHAELQSALAGSLDYLDTHRGTEADEISDEDLAAASEFFNGLGI